VAVSLAVSYLSAREDALEKFFAVARYRRLNAVDFGNVYAQSDNQKPSRLGQPR
jgi:hypothetical protein